ncbi:MAG: phosphate--acyl-ACP acyltransferase, partial [Deltaproteobacteria bacterium]|nr:phosphate--acyl-ACP acyltransferase [Deltaproteobacteria bacterium]
YSEYGGAPLLGVNGNCVICHGASNAKAIMNAIVLAASLAKN